MSETEPGWDVCGFCESSNINFFDNMSNLGFK